MRACRGDAKAGEGMRGVGWVEGYEEGWRHVHTGRGRRNLETEPERQGYQEIEFGRCSQKHRDT